MKTIENDSACKSTFDLSQFITFDINTRHGLPEIKVNDRVITLSSALGSKFKRGQQVELLLNKKGNILIIRESDAGVKLCPNGTSTKSKHIFCKSLGKALAKMGQTLPAAFRAEYNEDMNCWVGRLGEYEAKTKY